MDLIDCISLIKAEQAKLPTSSDVTDAGRQLRQKAIEDMCRTIENALPKVTIKVRWDGARVSIMGVRATCTAGINGAFTNWIAAARRKLDLAHSNGEKENVG